MSQQLKALGILFTALPENIKFIEKMRKKYEIEFPENKKDKKKYIKSWSNKTIMAVEADCHKHVAKLEDVADLTGFLKASTKWTPKVRDVINKSFETQEQYGDLYADYEIKLARSLANYILKDTWLPFPESMTGTTLKIKEKDGIIWYMAAFGPLTDMKQLTKKMIKIHKKKYKQPKIEARKYLRNAWYFSLFKMGKTDAEIAQLELEPQLKNLNIELYSEEYFELEKKTTEKIRTARWRFHLQFKELLDT